MKKCIRPTVVAVSVLVLLLFTLSHTWSIPVSANPEVTEPTYTGIAKYYDNRKCVVTISMDDLIYNYSQWQDSLSMFTAKKLYHTVGIITNHSSVLDDWDFIQYWVNQGYTEAGSHSRNHVHPPYTGYDPSLTPPRPRISYEWQIKGSKQDIIGNLTLPDWWRYGEKEYVYAWIEPYGSSDETVRLWLGDCYYLSDRNINSGVYSFSTWDYANELFDRVGHTLEMGTPPWGGISDVPSLNSKFDTSYVNGGIYHLIVHPSWVNWNTGSYADQHTTYISNRKDVWYVPFGLLYLYHWIYDRNVLSVTSTGAGQDKIFRIDIGSVNHQNYGISYPITYVFDIPSSWTTVDAYYRYRETDAWTVMTRKKSDEYFNGVQTLRFNFTEHKAYVSVAFSELSDTIYLQLRWRYPTADFVWYPSTPKVNQTVAFDASRSIPGWNGTHETPIIEYRWDFGDGNITTVATQTINHTYVAEGNYTITLAVTDTQGLQHNKTETIIVSMAPPLIGDINGDGVINILDSILLANAFGSKPGSPNWDPRADLNNDNAVNILDAIKLAGNFGKSET